ncbi:hypothetical protein QQF64_031087 [Cirrhinus molitorella]|uniref:Apolipoprotein L3 n=1 Tax=Cirrhinus molitorella TaxID=172907 RepID=A0ABR3N5G7_9TELE
MADRALPNTFSEDLHQLVKDTQRPPGIEFETTEVDVLRNLAEGLETVHFNTTVSSLTGGVVGLAGGITSVVGLILAPFTLGASLIVTGVGIGTAVAGGITAGASNITNINQQTNRQKIKMIITEFQEKITSIICCIQNISEAVETLENEFSTGSGSLSGMSAGVRLGRGLGGIPELIRLTQVVNIGKIAAQAARAVRVVETIQCLHLQLIGTWLQLGDRRGEGLFKLQFPSDQLLVVDLMGAVGEDSASPPERMFLVQSQCFGVDFSHVRLNY